MVLFKSSIFVLYIIVKCDTLEIKPAFYDNNQKQCENVAVNPYFDINIVIGSSWRIYHTWNLRLGEKCLDMVFKNATKQIVERIWSDMSEYLEQQPVWEAATLLVSMGKAKHELLLFADQGPAGKFLGVPNVIRDANITPIRGAVPLLNFLLKLVRGGKFLLVMDCQVGGATLSARTGTAPYRPEINAEAAALKLGDGFHACTEEKHKEERFLG